MRQRLVERGLIDSEFRLTEDGNEYCAALIARLEREHPESRRYRPKAEAVITMGDPRYEYQPQTAEHRAKLSAAQRERLGIPAGHRRVYGVHVPEAVAEKIRPLATEIACKKGYDAAHAFVAAAEANEWKYDASKVPPKNGNVWTEERRKKASEGAKAMHARRRASAEEAAKRWAAKQAEKTVNVQTKAQTTAPPDSAIREIHGVLAVNGKNEPLRLTIQETDAWVRLDAVYSDAFLRPAHARYVAEQLVRMADRIDRRAGAAA